MSATDKQICSYERDPYLRELQVDIIRIGEEDGRPFAVLDDTILYPEGGGQPSDLGWLNEVRIVDVQRVFDRHRSGSFRLADDIVSSRGEEL